MIKHKSIKKKMFPLSGFTLHRQVNCRRSDLRKTVSGSSKKKSKIIALLNLLFRVAVDVVELAKTCFQIHNIQLGPKKIT